MDADRLYVNKAYIKNNNIKGKFMGKSIYTNVPRNLSDVLKDVRSGRIGLPDLQRPFVWKDNKVRDLFDSMLKGFPIGYIMLWESPTEYEDKKESIGKNGKPFKDPKELVIDGQQRLTALVSSMYGILIKDKKFQDRRIKIGFNPLIKKFDVWTSAIENDAEYISDISEAFLSKENNTSNKFRKEFLSRLNSSRLKNEQPLLTEEEENLVEENINELLQLENYSIPSLEISHNAGEEEVADIFVRVNSAGQKLTENDFILTLISVYDKERRDQIDKFCEDSRIPADKTAYNHLIAVDPSHLIRMTIGVGFKRARLKYAYMILRGKDLQTGITSVETRNKNLLSFSKALTKVLDLNNWHGYLNILKEAGYISDSLITSSNAVVFSYVLFLIAKYDYHMESMSLRRMIKKWFFMTTITSFYTSNTESDVEKQFADMRELKNASELESYIQKVINSRFTDDFFSITLPLALETSSAISPGWNGFLASQVVLGFPVLFGTAPISSIYMSGSSGTKKNIDKHHVFPKNYLSKINITSDRDRNQTGNFVHLDYNTNIHISDKAPNEYLVEFRNKLGEEELAKTCEQNALPIGFENMEYFEFLSARRSLMAKLVKQAYERLLK